MVFLSANPASAGIANASSFTKSCRLFGICTPMHSFRLTSPDSEGADEAASFEGCSSFCGGLCHYQGFQFGKVFSAAGPHSEGAYEAVSFRICGRLFEVCTPFNRRRFRSYLPLWPSLVMFIPNLLLSLLVRVRLKRACLIEIPGA